MGYHTREFKKGVLGEFSKVEEEWEELLDARLQDGKILELCELADLHGAIDAYVKAKFNLTIEDVAKMARMTSSAFEDGTRGPTTIVVQASEIFASKRCRNCDCEESDLDGGDTVIRKRADGEFWCQYCWFDSNPRQCVP